MLGDQDMDKNWKHGIDGMLAGHLSHYKRLYAMHVRTMNEQMTNIHAD